MRPFLLYYSVLQATEPVVVHHVDKLLSALLCNLCTSILDGIWDTVQKCTVRNWEGFGKDFGKENINEKKPDYWAAAPFNTYICGCGDILTSHIYHTLTTQGLITGNTFILSSITTIKGFVQNVRWSENSGHNQAWAMTNTHGGSFWTILYINTDRLGEKDPRMLFNIQWNTNKKENKKTKKNNTAVSPK